MNVKSMAALIGREGLLQVDQLQVPVTIDDVKNSYGTPRYLVAPIAGAGSAWVNADRVKVGA
jgi:hypothetical protein